MAAGLTATLAAHAGLPAPQSLPAPATAKIDFVTHIAPILQAHCLACHGTKAKGGLRLDTREHALKGSDSGAVLQPGKSADSRLIHLVAGVAEDMLVMPPKGRRLSNQDIALLRAWIDQGAAWPTEVVLTAKDGGKAAETHWAFQPLRRPNLPTFRQAGWVRNPIDRFIVSRLEAEGISPSSEADRATLIRRVTLDLIGLPPTPAEVEAFVQDNRPDAYQRLVDRLLASPHYGEKWARPWLDLCHYADSDGYLTDQLRPVAWRYRQWLVDALNRDLPWDQFTTQQLAGDLLPHPTTDQLLATGFLRNTLSNREGGADLEEFRVEQVVDRTMMVGTTWLGLTLGCARCHDHKFDPISQKEFYQLYAYFDSADEVNIDAPLPGEREAYLARRPTYERKRAELLQPVQRDVDALQQRWEEKLLEAAAHPARDATWDRQWEVLGLVWGGDLGEGQLEGTYIVRLERSKRTQDQKDRLLDYFLEMGSVVDPKRFKELKLEELSKKLKQLQAESPGLTRAPVMRETAFPRPTYLHVRGNFRSPGVAVQPGLPAVGRTDLKSVPLPANRLGLAQWLVAPENPLPARVTVNRFWQEFFGRGLVFTAEDFGVRGEKPTHPELLDWLAVEFRECGWSMKIVHRWIVTSATYRQASRVRPELAARDPHNRLLARQASLRLSADQVRDATLAVSGLLNRRIGGPCVFPTQPESVSLEAETRHKWKPSQGADRYRRGLYTFLQRLTPFAQKVTFDAPAPSRSCTRRERSNTPLQALTLLNDPVFFEAAQALAARVLHESKPDPADRIDRAFRLCLARPPRPAERERLAAYYQEQLSILRQEPAAAAKLFPGRVEGVEPMEGAAWTAVCSVLLNLHEFITRD
jgi:hypothetical protein